MEESLFNLVLVFKNPLKLGDTTSVIADSQTEYIQHIEASHHIQICAVKTRFCPSVSENKLRMEAEVKLFTLNCWGLGMGISKHRDERMQDIGLFISQQDYDIVFLQV